VAAKKNSLYGEKKTSKHVINSNNYYLFFECLKLSDSKLMISAKTIVVFCIKKHCQH